MKKGKKSGVFGAFVSRFHISEQSSARANVVGRHRQCTIYEFNKATTRRKRAEQELNKSNAKKDTEIRANYKF